MTAIGNLLNTGHSSPALTLLGLPALLVAALLLAPVGGASAQEPDRQPQAAPEPTLLRLFSAPEQRRLLDQLRLEAAQPLPEPGEPEAVEPEPAELSAPAPELIQVPDIIYALKGIVQREGGRHTVWLNEQALDAGSLPAGVSLMADRVGLTVRQPVSGRLFQLLPGQVLNLTTGELLESYQRLPESALDGSDPLEDAQARTPGADATVPAGNIDPAAAGPDQPGGNDDVQVNDL